MVKIQEKPENVIPEFPKQIKTKKGAIFSFNGKEFRQIPGPDGQKVELGEDDKKPKIEGLIFAMPDGRLALVEDPQDLAEWLQEIWVTHLPDTNLPCGESGSCTWRYHHDNPPDYWEKLPGGGTGPCPEPPSPPALVGMKVRLDPSSDFCFLYGFVGGKE